MKLGVVSTSATTATLTTESRPAKGLKLGVVSTSATTATLTTESRPAKGLKHYEEVDEQIAVNLTT